MKNFTLSLLLILGLSMINQSAAQKRTVELPAFSELSFGISGTIYLTQGPQKIEVECSDETFENIDFNISGNSLHIGSRKNWSWNGRNSLTIYISMENIEEVALTGSGDIIGENVIKSESLKFRLSGSGSMSLKADSRNVNSEVTGSGNIRLMGQSENIRARVSGSGSIKAEELTVNVAEANITGSGSIHISVIEEIVSNITGSGNVYYTGDPARREAHNTGSGRMKKNG